ncbi:site-specific DNA-methyltransferase [Pseudomonas sp. CFBP13506]|uniref:site-specific DNA-methyltransferase n=1 Tax=Pseudomonas sp. CFBP13506 TaxID=2184010 RepID=UPI0010C0AF37|nr:site-specific DNA-methyltransferase [Pseudomonas sp. CFBP13506]TKJ58699.1 site-specific DNA-methyltransferase [Pseudomonas sp. CFBP13506]
MDKLKMHSQNLTEANIDKLAALFPNCITEARDAAGELKKAIDFDLLRQELSSSIVDGPQERYQLNWPGKREALLMANAPIAKTLRPFRDESIDFDSTRNLFIEGDNLEALKLLQEVYLNRVKMIYIDPPYNTGNDFIYDDDFSENSEAYFERSNQQDATGRRLVANTEANGRFHSDWLSMMYPRIKLAWNLLKDDGSLFISIDDNEVDSLKKICDEIFGAQNFVATVIWQKVYAPKNSAKHFSEDHDYIVIYAKNASSWTPTLLDRTAEQDALYKNPDQDTRGPWMSDNLTARNAYADGQYEVEGPTGKVFVPGRGLYWRHSKANFEKLIADNRIWWGADGNNMPRLKRFLSEVSGGRVPQTLWSYKEVGHTQEAKRELLDYVSFKNTENVLNSVKPTKLLKRAIKIATSANSDDIVMDFFAGSAPAGQAVVALNMEDGGNRRYILVQIPEVLPAPEDGFETIADLAKSRLRNFSAKVESDSNSQEGSSDDLKLDVGFRYFKIDTSNMNEVYYIPDAVRQDLLSDQVDNIRVDRTAEDLLFQVLLDWGVDLALPITQQIIAGKTVYFVDGNALVACFDIGIDEDFIKKLVGHKPLRVVFRDAGFASDSVKINVGQMFKLLSPATEIKTL